MLNEQMGWAIGMGKSTGYGSVLRTIDGGKQWEQVTPALFSGEISYLYILNEMTAWLLNGATHVRSNGSIARSMAEKAGSVSIGTRKLIRVQAI
jgi:photosystem II stability/assembly factor-like uncharacterized protein